MQLHGRMLSLSSVQSSQAKTCQELEAAMVEARRTAGGMATALQEFGALSRSVAAADRRVGEVEQSLRALAKDVQDGVLAGLDGLGTRVGELEETVTGQAAQFQGAVIKLAEGKADLKHLNDLKAAVTDLRAAAAGASGRRSKMAGGAAAGFRCLVCDTSLAGPGGGISSSKSPAPAVQFRPNATLNPELYFDYGEVDRRRHGSASPPKQPPHSARARLEQGGTAAADSRAFSPADWADEEGRIRSLQHGRQPQVASPQVLRPPNPSQCRRPLLSLASCSWHGLRVLLRSCYLVLAPCVARSSEAREWSAGLPGTSGGYSPQAHAGCRRRREA